METELERLVVRLTGDGSEYQRMLQQAQQETREVAASVEQSGAKIEGVAASLKTFASGALAFLAGMGIKDWLHEAFGAFQEAEEVAISLSATLRANGRDVDRLMDEYQDFALGIQEMTGVGDEATLMNLRLAESFNLTGSAAEKAVQDAMGLAKAANSSTEAMIRLTAAMAEGDTERAMMFSRMVPQLRGVKDEQEFVARYSKLVAAGFDAIQESANTAAGQLRTLKEDYGNLMEEFGKVITEIVNPFISGMRSLVQWFRELSPEVKRAIVVVAAMTVGVLALVAAIATAGIVANTLFGGVGLIVGVIATAGAALAVWVTNMDGVTKAWEYLKETAVAVWGWIKATAMEFWDWLRPVARQVMNVLAAGWEIVKLVAVGTWEIIKIAAMSFLDTMAAPWRAMFGGMVVDWGKVRDVAIKTLIGIEFVMRNFKDVVDFVWDNFKLQVIETNRKLFDLVGDIRSVGTALSQLARGDYAGAAGTLALARARTEMSVYERELRASLARRADILGEAYVDFEARRLRELFAPNPQVDEELRRQGQHEEEMRNEGKKKEMEKFEAAARYSAEAVSRIYAYTERMRQERRPTPATAARAELAAAGGGPAGSGPTEGSGLAGRGAAIGFAEAVALRMQPQEGATASFFANMALNTNIARGTLQVLQSIERLIRERPLVEINDANLED